MNHRHTAADESEHGIRQTSTADWMQAREGAEAHAHGCKISQAQARGLVRISISAGTGTSIEAQVWVKKARSRAGVRA